ncbi:TlpA family protein disulfide reductase [Bacillus sp. Marseille-P3661]|uniref:TlpA family protein disulfide reductase n=1 Tax=Bacillus sp. Marseille-P3661 TaxID=1936234 RepID=UPI000C83839D|nr:TlpA disulfide reductase family protein [Bacillus sp. Marseille-P3661]
MKKIIFIVIILGMFSWAVLDLVNSNEESANQEDTTGTEVVKESDTIGLERGQIAPDFELKTLEGETVRLSDYRGTRVFVNFWATWCPPCRAEMPDMEKVYKEMDNVEILAVNLTDSEQNEEVVEEFVADFGLTFPILMDRNSEVASMYRVQAYPTSYMIDSNGRIQFIAIGAMNHDLMVQEIEKMK